MSTIYLPSLDHDGKPYVKGPGKGLEYYGGTLWPELRFDSIDAAAKAALVANIAYEEGTKAARAEIRAALGLEATP